MPRSESAENHIFWDMWPLGPAACLNLKMDSSEIVPGRTTYTAQRHRKRFVDGRLVKSEPSPERRIYFPTAADRQVLSQRYTDADSALPDWIRIQADLIAEGHPAERLAVMSVPSILQLLANKARLLPTVHSGDDDDFRSGQWFTQNTCIPASRLRQAARKKRKTKRVRTKMIDGVKCYSVSDARGWWPLDKKNMA